MISREIICAHNWKDYRHHENQKGTWVVEDFQKCSWCDAEWKQGIPIPRVVIGYIENTDGLR